MSLTAKLALLNDADLSKLSDRLAALRAEMERGLEATAVNPPSAVTATELQTASAATGLTPEQLLDALETARRRGLI
jgi:hypothetical protein